MDELKERDIQDPRLRRLYDYWRQRHVGDRPPGRADLDPLDFPYAMGFVTLIDVEADPLRFRFRLAATAVTEHLGYELTGKYLDSVPEAGMRDYLDASYRRVVALGRPLYESGVRILDLRVWRHESVLLPCADADGAINMIISARVTETPRPVQDAPPGLDRR